MITYANTVSPADSATLIYHDAMARATDAIATYNAAAMAKVEAELLADQHRDAIAHIKAQRYTDVADAKNESARNADLLKLLGADDGYCQRAKDLADTERRIAEQRVEIEIAQMQHSIAKRQLDFAAASMRSLS